MAYYVESSGRGVTTLVDGEVVGPFKSRVEAQSFIDYKSVHSLRARMVAANYKVSFIKDSDVVQHPRYRTLKARK